MIQVTFYVLALHGAAAAVDREAAGTPRKELVNAELD